MNFDKIIIKIFEKHTLQGTQGKIKDKFALNGNQEPIEDEIIKNVKDIGFDYGFVTESVSVIYDDDGFSRVLIETFNASFIMDHIKDLEKKLLVQNNPQVLLGALNKAICMLDDYNNMYGDEMPKTEEISDLDEILRLHQ
jgi:hypothetical protein